MRQIFLAMSCFQGRTQDQAWDALLALQPDGVQLTPGNLPSPGFEARVRDSGVPVRLHHGFAWDRYRAPVYEGLRLAIGTDGARSVHPPQAACGDFDAWLEAAVGDDAIFETMYPGYHLGTGAQLRAAMSAGLRLAVDIAHLHIQTEVGALDEVTRAMLFEYERIEEVHVSANDGRGDQHRPIDHSTPHLRWAGARAHAGAVLVLECYMHRLDSAARRAQLDRLKEITCPTA